MEELWICVPKLGVLTLRGTFFSKTAASSEEIRVIQPPQQEGNSSPSEDPRIDWSLDRDRLQKLISIIKRHEITQHQLEEYLARIDVINSKLIDLVRVVCQIRLRLFGNHGRGRNHPPG
ncbi:UNVERIFIED_CONTAM: hypothetical protein PYX00_009968 [Menopon gallinae]|uniref:Uncharacterized protein n=1 Tax=Menopon gallinae TaxID=328185 RepID=A0AAW2HDH1_9NEOP